MENTSNRTFKTWDEMVAEMEAGIDRTVSDADFFAARTTTYDFEDDMANEARKEMALEGRIG